MLEESFILRFTNYIGILTSLLETLYQNGHIRKKNVNGEEVYYIDEEAAKEDEQIKRIIDRGTLFAYYQIIDEDINIYEDETEDAFDCYDGNRIADAAAIEARLNLYSINPSYLEIYLCDILDEFKHYFPYFYEPNDTSKLTAYQYNIDYLKEIYSITRKLMPHLREREIIDINTLERILYYAWEDLNQFISNVKIYIRMFNLNPETINKKINYNLFNQENILITPDKLCLNLKTNINIDKLYYILIEKEYISSKTELEDFRSLFNGNGNISQPIEWIKKTSKKQKSKASLIDFLKLSGISTSKLHDKDLIAKYFLDDERKPMRLNLYNNKANERSEYYNELKDIIRKVSTK